MDVKQHERKESVAFRALEPCGGGGGRPGRSSSCDLCARKVTLVIIIIMEICKAPTLQLKALNKHTHIMHIEMEKCYKKYISTSVHNYAKDAHARARAHTHTHTHTRTHTVQSDGSEGQCGLTERFRERSRWRRTRALVLQIKFSHDDDGDAELHAEHKFCHVACTVKDLSQTLAAKPLCGRTKILHTH